MNTNSALPCAVIFTALAIEYQAVSEHITGFYEEIHSQGTIYNRGTFPPIKPLWDIGIVETSMGNTRASLEAERAISFFKPSIALFVGIAGGLKDVKIGDIVIGKKVYNYESGKADMNFKMRPEVGNSSYRMVQRAQVVARKKA